MERITALSPGASPPPVLTAIFFDIGSQSQTSIVGGVAWKQSARKYRAVFLRFKKEQGVRVEVKAQPHARMRRTPSAAAWMSSPNPRAPTFSRKCRTIPSSSASDRCGEWWKNWSALTPALSANSKAWANVE